MSDGEPSRWIVVTEGAKTLPVEEILTGRGFITGKSGSGKSNTAGVIAEQLLENGYNMLIVDPEGEYYGLKEQYELLHVGADDFCDVSVDVENAEKLAEIALEKNMPVILDVSGFFSESEANELIEETVKHLFVKEKEIRKPFLLMVEEMHEFIPQQGSSDLSKLLERVGKRGRKRGLGMLGMSQRPAAVDKDYITQCDWLVWHKLTWDDDVNQAGKILGSERADDVEDFDPGEAYLMTDWDDTVDHVHFKRKQTHDGGATPGLENFDRPDLKSVGDELVSELQNPSAAEGAAESVGGDGNGQTQLDAEAAVDDVEVVDAETDVGASSNGAASVEAVDGDESAPSESAEIESSVDVDEDADVADLRAELERKQRRNEILKDEVRELKQILDDVEPDDGEGPFESRGASAEVAQPPAPADGVDQLPAERRQGRQPDPPKVPRRPPDRDGVAGNLVEFVQMLLYVFRLAVYRTRRAIVGSYPTGNERANENK